MSELEIMARSALLISAEVKEKTNKYPTGTLFVPLYEAQTLLDEKDKEIAQAIENHKKGLQLLNNAHISIVSKKDKEIERLNDLANRCANYIKSLP